VHLVGPRTLDPRELLGVEAKLDHVSRLRPPRELGVDDLVEAVRPPLEKVRPPAPRTVDEGRLVDKRRAVPDRLLGRGGRRGPTDVRRIADLDDAALERGDVCSLVLFPFRRISSA
jgi:hypothetical protein